MSIANQFKRTEARKKSTADRKDGLGTRVRNNVEKFDEQQAEKLGCIEAALPVRSAKQMGHMANETAGTQALPVDTTIPKQKRGRPPTGFDPKEYHRLYQRDKRAADKLGISVKEFRSQKGQGK